MNRLFPMMLDQPERRTIVSGLTYWAASFLVIPFFLALFTADIHDKPEWIAYFQVGYHICNFVVVLCCFFPYLKESFLNVQIHGKSFLTVCVIAIGLIAVLRLFTVVLGFFSGSENILITAFDALPIVEMDPLFHPSELLFYNPVLGTICMVLLAPLVISCLYYACCFAPLCSNHPVAAYLIVSLALLIPRLLISFIYWDLSYDLLIYIMHLPVHLIACWGYQKTDTIWTPIAVHTASNLITSVFLLFFFGII